MESIPPHSSGVYRIRCTSTGKIYVGSSVDLRNRWASHRGQLRRGAHGNRRLQLAWNKYGEAEFDFSVLEFAQPTDLLRAEQAWLDRTGCADRRVGFNVFYVAGSPGDAFAQVWEGFVTPDGQEVTITNLYEFCRRHNLNFSAMHRLAKGKSKLKSHKGWTHKNSPRLREYVKTYDGFIAPNGHAVSSITNLAAFCREHKLDNTHMVAVARGRICSHRGWTYRNGKQNLNLPKTYTGFINPVGERVVITNLSAFCREQGLHHVHMHGLINGKRKSHKGWTWRQNNE